MAVLGLSSCTTPAGGDGASPKADAIVGQWECKSNLGSDSIHDTYTFLPNGTGTQRTVSSQAGFRQDFTQQVRWKYAGGGTWTSQHNDIPWKCEYRLSHGNLAMQFEGGGVNGVMTLTRGR
jgi:hypothetical protein